nr:Pyridoxamine 5'-phosphate oxidase [uncultured bacterium]AIA13499.1 Pyridoxamine 5'-phosphate oxidase [uncultured bacterium]
MGKRFEVITPELAEWIKEQKMFFVATAPLDANGHINCSPKGLDSFRIINETTVAYQDITGSGIETISHLRENKRIVIMFCAFEGPPKIVRLHGSGEVILTEDIEFTNFSELFPPHQGVRALIKILLDRITDSCGFGVPLYDFRKDRDQMEKWALAKGAEGLVDYRKEKNSSSIDGLSGLPQP